MGTFIKFCLLIVSTYLAIHYFNGNVEPVAASVPEKAVEEVSLQYSEAYLQAMAQKGHQVKIVKQCPNNKAKGMRDYGVIDGVKGYIP